MPRERDKADEFAQKLMPLIDEIRTAGKTSLTGIANELNGRSIPTPLGRRWYPSTVKNLLTLLGNDCGQNIDGCMESMSLDLHRDKNGPLCRAPPVQNPRQRCAAGFDPGRQ
jgi:hypothetical protein